MNSQPSAGGLSQLIKRATPLVGRVGAVASGIIGLLAALEKVSGEVITTVEGFLLVVAIVASSIVIWGRATRVVDGKSSHTPLYSVWHRRVAAVVLALASVLTILFVIRVGGEYIRAQARERLLATRPNARPSATRPTERPTERATVVAASTANSTPGPTSSAAPSTIPAATPAGTSTAPATPIPNAAVLTAMGFDAIATRNYTQALSLFQRALQVNATSPQAQLGLGEALYFTAQYAQAIVPLRAALELNPNLYDAHAYLGFSYEQRADLVRAQVEYQEYLRVAPKDAALRPDVTEALRRNTTPNRSTPTPLPTR